MTTKHKKPRKPNPLRRKPVYASLNEKYASPIHIVGCRMTATQAEELVSWLQSAIPWAKDNSHRLCKWHELPTEFLCQVETSQKCWIWTGELRKGYGYYHDPDVRRRVKAHRYVYKKLYGTIDSDKSICHKCGNASCVRPSHLYAGTHQENMLDTVRHGRHFWANKTHCPKGHPYNAENTVTIPSRKDRRCRACIKARNQTPEARAARRLRTIRDRIKRQKMRAAEYLESKE